MKRFVLQFLGRKQGAIGIWYNCCHEVEAEDEEAAWASPSLYEKYDVYRRGKCVQMSEVPQ